MDDKLLPVLEEIRDNQQLQLKRQEDALALQREQFAMFQKHADRAEHLHDRAEGGQLVNVARKALAIVLPIIIILIAYLSWLILR